MFYGWSWKSWQDHYLIAFDTQDAAQEWLNRPENDFRDREIITEDRAKELTGGLWDDWDQDYPLHINA